MVFVMRRKDREITDTARIEAIISACSCCRLGFNDGGEVYIVPLNFGWEKENGAYRFYFHGAREGRKIALLEGAPRVGFEMDCSYALRIGELAGNCTASFSSIIGVGRARLVDDGDEIRRGLLSIMRHNTGRSDWSFNEDMLRAVRVFRLDVEALSCKVHE